MKAVLRSPSRRVLEEGVYVLTALGIAYERTHDDGLFVLLVSPEDAPQASRELVAYLREDPLEPSTLVAPARRGRPWPGAIAYIVVVVVLYVFAASRMFGIDWYGSGVLDASRIRAGEWWRAATALGLHGGMEHVAGNVVFGALFGALLAEACGNGLGWLIFLLSGVLGNLVNVALRDGDHRAVGASTAIFGALGALGAHEWARGWTDARDVARRWAPLIGGIILLGFLGLGGENTDVLAHVTGFGCGAVMGVVAARWSVLRRLGRRAQIVLAGVASAGFVAAWAASLLG